MFRRILSVLLVFFFMIHFTLRMSQLIRERSYASILTFHTCASEPFRRQEIPPTLYTSLIAGAEGQSSWTDKLTYLMLSTDFHLDSSSDIVRNPNIFQKFKPLEYQFLQNCYRAIWKDPVFFPVSSDHVFFENSWLKRSGCGEVFPHQGTDLWVYSSYPGYFPVLSVSDGTVISAGWKTRGKYQLIITGPSGGIFYYSLLSSFERNWKYGDTVSAGDILGYTGKAESNDSHSLISEFSCLHFGIYIKDSRKHDISINPYWVLMAIHKKTRNYTY